MPFELSLSNDATFCSDQAQQHTQHCSLRHPRRTRTSVTEQGQGAARRKGQRERCCRGREESCLTFPHISCTMYMVVLSSNLPSSVTAPS